MKSVLLIGQSNMAGRGFLNEATPIYNENIIMLEMAEPIHFDRSVAGVGPASFAQACVSQIKMNKSDLSLVRKEAVPSMNGIRKVLYFAMQSVR